MPALHLARLGGVAACAPAAVQSLRIGFLGITGGKFAILDKHPENGRKPGLAVEADFQADKTS